MPHIYGQTRVGRDVRHRLRHRRGPAVLHRRPAPPRPRPAHIVRRRRAGQPRVRRDAVGDRAVHRGRPAKPDRHRARRRYGSLGQQVQNDAENYLAGHQRLHRRDQAQPQQDARRVRGDRSAAGCRELRSQADIIAIASLVGGIFGKGGGARARRDAAAAGLPAAVRRPSAAGGCGASGRHSRIPTRRPRSARRSSTTRRRASGRRADGEALADPGTFKPVDVVASGTSSHDTRSAQPVGRCRACCRSRC